MNSMNATKLVNLTIPFPSADTATLAYEVLSVDKELIKSGITKEITTDGPNLLVNFHGTELKKLRVAVNSFLKNITLIVKTLNQFQ